MTTSDAPKAQSLVPQRNSERLPGVTRKVRAAIEAMVWKGLHRRDAAKHAEMAEHSLYQALRRPPVRAFYLSQLEVLRTSERARNIHALVAIRDESENDMARVRAVSVIESISEAEAARGGYAASPLQPGLVIQVVTTGAEAVKVAPVIEHDDTGD
jgi:hypothetical protein